MRTGRVALTILAALTITSSQALARSGPQSAVDEYAIDDGVGEVNVGPGGTGSLVILNQFNVVEGADLITSVRIAWGDVPEGSPFTVLIFDDPNDDGDPSDIGPGDLLVSGPAATGPADSDVFTDYPVAPTDVGDPGDSFFVGACIVGFVSPARLDFTTVLGQSWFASDPSPADCADPNAMSISMLPTDDLGFPGTWMIRASGTAATPTFETTWGAVKTDGSR